MKLLELQGVVQCLIGERNEWYGRFLGAAQNPAGELTIAPRPSRQLELVIVRVIFTR